MNSPFKCSVAKELKWTKKDKGVTKGQDLLQSSTEGMLDQVDSLGGSNLGCKINNDVSIYHTVLMLLRVTFTFQYSTSLFCQNAFLPELSQRIFVLVRKEKLALFPVFPG